MSDQDLYLKAKELVKQGITIEKASKQVGLTAEGAYYHIRKKDPEPFFTPRGSKIIDIAKSPQQNKINKKSHFLILLELKLAIDRAFQTAMEKEARNDQD